MYGAGIILFVHIFYTSHCIILAIVTLVISVFCYTIPLSMLCLSLYKISYWSAVYFKF